MGEIVEPLPTPSLGVASIDASKVTMPTEEHIVSLTIELTASDRKWSRFAIRTTQRTIQVSPGEVGEAAFRAYCDAWAKMLATPQGVAVLASARAFIAGKPLELKPAVVEAAVVAPK